MNTSSYTLGDVFSHYIVAKQPNGVKKTVAEFLKENDLSKAALKSIVRQLGGSLSSFKEDLVDLLFFYIGFCLEDHYLSDEEKLNIKLLKILFNLSEHDLDFYKGTEIKKLLAIEVKRLLTDQRIDDSESLYQVDLQDVFGLSYDRFLELTSEPVEEVVNDWIRKIACDGDVTEQERDFLYQHVLRLDRLYKFTRSQRRVLENKQRWQFESEVRSDNSNYQEHVSSSYTPELQRACTILGIELGTPFDVGKTAYKRLAQSNHPDKVCSMKDEIREMAESRMKEINTAFAVYREFHGI